MAFNTKYADQLHRHIVIWLDEHIGEVGNNEKMKERFRRITYPLHTFTNVSSTVAFIREQQANISIFLIVSGKLAHEILPIVFPIECVIYIFIFCRDMMEHMDLASTYIEKVLMHDSNEDLLIDLTNEIAKQLIKDAEKRKEQGDFEHAAGLYDWADWLFNDADTLRHSACQRYRQIIQANREKLRIDHGAVFTNQFIS